MTSRLTAAALVLASLAGCVSGRNCVNDIPDDLRADVLRYVVDRRLCHTELMPRDDYWFALGGGGLRFEELDSERRRRVALLANGYANCITTRVEPEY